LPITSPITPLQLSDQVRSQERFIPAAFARADRALIGKVPLYPVGELDR
jgi:hypothetical protein